MLHCRDDLAETLRAVQRIACIRRRLRRSLFRLCGRHANWKRPPDALQLPARGPAAARSLLRTRSAAVSTPPTRLLHPLCTVAIQRTLIRVVEIFSIALFLYIISTTVHSYTNCPLCPRPPLQYPLPSPTRLRGAPASSCSCAVPDRVEGAGCPDAEPARGGRSSRASALHSHSRSNASRSPPSCSPSTSSYSPPVRVRYTAS